MQVKPSLYLEQQKPVYKKLLARLLQEYPFATILATEADAKIYQVSKGGTVVYVHDILSASGTVIKVYDGKSYGECSLNELSENNIDEVLSKVRSTLMPLADGFSVNEYAQLSDEPLTMHKSTEYEIHPSDMGDEAIVEHITSIRQSALDMDERLLDCNVFCNYQRYSKLFLSRNRDLEQNAMWMCGGMSLMAARGEEIKDYYKGFSNLGGAEVLQKMSAEVPNAVKTVIELLDSEPIVPGEYECVCTPDVTGMIVHEAFGHGVEMDMFVKDRALAKSYVGKQVASPLVTMHDGAAVAKETATCFFDDEGTTTGDTLIIDKGILVRGISDAQSAMFLGTPPTGNGRRESYLRKAYTRMTNTYFEGGTDSVEDMIASIKDGFLIDNPTSGMEDPKNWGIQCMVNFARQIKDGKLTGKIFSPIVLTGYVPDLLKSITMMSPNVELAGGGFCGKGYKEWVKVSDGGPYIKAKIRLG
ncbi:MAG: TldD/PmbA family protein [Eubacteriales bacterium]|nr:TldD/PmbA family protein [Eubacteriales bacterium]